MSSDPQKSIRPFVFEQSFDVLASPEELEVIKQKEEEEAAPTFSEEELAEAQENAYKHGLQAGLQEAQTGIEQQVSATLEVVGATLGRLNEQQQLANELIGRETMELAVAAIEKLLPEYVQKCGVEEVQSFVGDIISRILEEPRITIRVAEELTTEIERNLNDLASRIGFGGTLVVTGDNTLGPADCRIRWSEGEAEKIVEATLREIEALTDGVPRRRIDAPLEVAADVSAPEPAGDLANEAHAPAAEELPPVEATPEAQLPTEQPALEGEVLPPNDVEAMPADPATIDPGPPSPEFTDQEASLLEQNDINPDELSNETPGELPTPPEHAEPA